MIFFWCIISFVLGAVVYNFYYAEAVASYNLIKEKLQDDSAEAKAELVGILNDMKSKIKV